MLGVDFRIFQDGRGWSWQVLGAGGEVSREGAARTRAEAASWVIRETLRSVIQTQELASVREAV
jgi:hypothetical protein